MKVLSYLLLPLAALYGLIIRLRAYAYRTGWKKSYPVSVPVISVGNITIGGTGKTPMALYLLATLQDMGYRPGYLSRGYGRASTGYLKVDPQAPNPRIFGDEAFLIAFQSPHTPVAVCEDRVLGAKQLIQDTGIDILVLDDAFQHMRIQRDLDIVMIDASRLPHQDFLLPAGRLREPISALARAHFLILSKLPPDTDPATLWATSGLQRLGLPTAAFAMTQRGIQPFHDLSPSALTPMQDWIGQPVIAFSGLGNNAYFQAQLQAAGLHVQAFFPFPDHHEYTDSELSKILETRLGLKEISGKFGPVPILSTEKDYFRLRAAGLHTRLQDQHFYFVAVEMKPISGADSLRTHLQKRR